MVRVSDPICFGLLGQIASFLAHILQTCYFTQLQFRSSQAFTIHFLLKELSLLRTRMLRKLC